MSYISADDLVKLRVRALKASCDALERGALTTSLIAETFQIGAYFGLLAYASSPAAQRTTTDMIERSIARIEAAEGKS